MNNVNNFLNLKFLLMESLKIQGEIKENTMDIYVTLKTLNIHEIHFNN